MDCSPQTPRVGDASACRQQTLPIRLFQVAGLLGTCALLATLSSSGRAVATAQEAPYTSAAFTSGPTSLGLGSGTDGSAVRVVIDPGHGGTDPGAIGNGIVEKEINLAIALRLRELLELDTLDANGGGEWEVLMTRETDASVSLGARTSLANSWPADRFVSIHHNAFSSSAANGTESFSFANGTISANLRDRLQEELLSALGLFNRGSKTANFFVLRETQMPAALTEGGFLTNAGDAAVLSGPNAVENSARAHLFGLQRHAGFLPYVPSDGPTNYCVAKTASPGCVPSITSLGTPSLSTGDFRVVCENVVSQQFGLLLWARQDAAIPLFGGTLCIGGSINRTPVQFSFGLGNANCSGRLELSLDAAFMQASGFQAGEDIYTQWWFRDPFLFPSDPVGLSDGLRFTVLP